MTLELIETEKLDSSTDDTEMDHWYCETCNPDPDLHCIAFCGTDVTDQAYGFSDDNVQCAVCEELVDLPCGKCGLR